MKIHRLFLFALFLGCFLPVSSVSQVTVAPFLSPKWQFLDNNGKPLSGGKVCTFTTGTTTPLATYSDNGVTPNANPVVLDSAGRATIYLANATYKIVVSPSTDNNSCSGAPITTADPVTWTTPLSTFTNLAITGNFTMQQPTAATAGANHSSSNSCIQGTFWNGAASANDQYCWSDVLGTGTNPTSTYTLTHSGSSGAATVSLPTLASATVAGALTAGTINNTCMADQQAGADMGIKIAACITALPNGGIIDATGFTPGSTQVWSTNIYSGAAKPYLIKLGQVIINVNVQQVPATQSLRLIGAGGISSGTGTCNTTINKNFDGTALFAPSTAALQGEAAGICFGIGVTQTSGYIFQPTAGAQEWWVHNVHFQNVYGGFNLTASAGTVLAGWRMTDITGNCNPNTVHTGTFLNMASTDVSVTTSEHFAMNWTSSGDVCIHDAPQFHLGSNTDSPQFVNINYSIGRANTSSQPNWLFDNTLGGGSVAPRLVSMVNVLSEGDGVTGNDILKIAAATDLTIIAPDFGGGDHCMNISGGQGIKIFGGQCNNNNNGGIYVTSAVVGLGLKVVGMDFYGNGVTAANSFDDIQIADGTTQVDIIGNNFGIIPSTVTNNSTRWPINFLGTTSIQISASGNRTNPARYANAGLIRDVTAVAASKIETEEGRKLIMRGPTGPAELILMAAASQNSWQIDNSEFNGSCLGITPSTAIGGVTFTTPQEVVCGTYIGVANTIRTPNGASIMGVTLKKGSGGGNYTNATTSYTVADSTNLCFTVTIPTGWKLGISASGALSTATAAVVAQAALTDNAACSTANAGILVESAPIQGAGIGIADSFALNWAITGDGAAHNIALQFKTSNVSDTASLINSSATVTPTMTFTLMPSN